MKPRLVIIECAGYNFVAVVFVRSIDPLSEGLVTPPLAVEKLSPRLSFFDNMVSCITWLKLYACRWLRLEGTLEAKSGGLFKKMKFSWEIPFLGARGRISIFGHNKPKKLDIGLLCPNMEIRPRAPKMEFFNFFSFLWKVLKISLLKSAQPPLYIKFNFKSSYARKRDFGLLCPNMEIQPDAPKNGIFQKKFIFFKRRPDFASNEPSTTPRH